ncbi:MAG: hypothetical protein M3Z22_07975 [Verrucomicrobiota bacterium]|nr:hypothetical protein [Verrucomicrobiota bacterium]
MIPSGHDTDASQRYYAWLWSRYLGRIPVPRTNILWSGPFWIVLFAIVMIGFFFLYASSFQRVHRKKGALYGIASYAGSILERHGRPSLLQIAVWLTVILWAVYTVLDHIFNGQVY